VSGPARAVGVLGCMAVIAAMDVLIRAAGLRRAVRLVSRSAVRPVRAGAAQADAITHGVVLAAAFYPRRALCLEQSLALCYLLRRSGLAAELRVGVQPRPFQAHAWVEVDGAPVAERGDLPLNLVAFAGLGG
jgi:hypothetical protein